MNCFVKDGEILNNFARIYIGNLVLLYASHSTVHFNPNFNLVRFIPLSASFNNE